MGFLSQLKDPSFQVQTLGEFTVRAKRRLQETADLASQVHKGLSYLTTRAVFFLLAEWKLYMINCRGPSVSCRPLKLQELRIRWEHFSCRRDILMLLPSGVSGSGRCSKPRFLSLGRHSWSWSTLAAHPAHLWNSNISKSPSSSSC